MNNLESITLIYR